MSTISGADLPPVDIITFGSPCQDMSIAGKRDGLDGSRSSLFYEAIRIVKEMRCKTNGEKPRFIVWENVPGAFSSNKGQDFKAVLEAVIGVKEPSASVPAPEKKGWPDADYYVGDGWSVAYRVFDAELLTTLLNEGLIRGGESIESTGDQPENTEPTENLAEEPVAEAEPDDTAEDEPDAEESESEDQPDEVPLDAVYEPQAEAVDTEDTSHTEEPQG